MTNKIEVKCKLHSNKRVKNHLILKIERKIVKKGNNSIKMKKPIKLRASKIAETTQI
jgi:hypothetical protein